MFRFIGLLIPLTICLTFTKATSSNLNCENLDTAACKLRFGVLLDNRLRHLNIEQLKTCLNLAHKFYTQLLEDLPANDPHVEPIQKFLSSVELHLPKLTNNIDGAGILTILNNMPGGPDPNFSNIDADVVSKKLYDELLLKHNSDGYHSAISETKKEAREKTAEFFKMLFDQLRVEDRAAYSEYEKFLAELQKPENPFVPDSLEEIAVFFDASYLKMMYHC